MGYLNASRICGNQWPIYPSKKSLLTQINFWSSVTVGVLNFLKKRRLNELKFAVVDDDDIIGQQSKVNFEEICQVYQVSWPSRTWIKIQHSW